MTAALPTALAELQAWPRWVCWRTLERDGKLTKVPVMYSGKPASTTDRGTWGRYSVCADAAEERGYDGIGYVFAEEDEYVGIDFDKCVTPPTAFAQAAGETGIHPAVAEIIAELGSYTEYSPTRTGLHVIVRAAFPEGGRNRTGKTPWGGEFECYDRARFFTITGDHVPGTPETIESRTQELAAVHSRIFAVPKLSKPFEVLATNGHASYEMSDEDIIEKIRKSKSGPKFDRLMAGDKSEYGDDDSAADMAFCNMLAWWLQGDAARMDTWFRRSGLYREKWEREDYRERTIAEGIASCQRGFYDPRRRDPSTPAKLEGRAEAVADSWKRAGDLIGLNDDRTIVAARSWGIDLDARVEVDISDGLTLTFRSLNTYTAPAKINSLISFQIGGEPHLTQTTIYELFRHLRLICDFHEAVTLEGRARDCGIAFLEDAGVMPAAMVNDQAGRWKGMAALADLDPVKEAKDSNDSIASRSVVLVDNDGTRYVRASWFAAHAREFVASSATAEQILGRMVAIGWQQPATEGRIKATQPGTKKTLNWAFFTVPDGWEKQ